MSEIQLTSESISTLKQTIQDLKDGLETNAPNFGLLVHKVKVQLNKNPNDVFILSSEEIKSICTGILKISNTSFSTTEKAAKKKELKNLGQMDADDVL